MAPYNPDAVPMEQWGLMEVLTYTKQNHHAPNPSTDPTKVSLPTPFTVCIIGASRGIGAGIATSYAQAGASGIVLASRRMSGLESVRDRCKAINPDVQIEIITCDITSAPSVASLATETHSRFGRLDVLVVNSGVTGAPTQRLGDDTTADAFAVTDVNYTGTYYAAIHFTPLLLASTGGAKAFITVNSASTLLVRGPVAAAKYGISKLAQARLTEMMHEQYSGEGLVAFAVHPGAVLTEL